MNAFSSSPQGRLLAIAIAIALIGGGIATTMSGSMGIPLMGLSLLGGVGLSIYAIALLIEQRPSFAMLSVILLPIALFLYMVGLGVVMHQARWGAYVFVALGAGFALLPLLGKRTDAAPSALQAPSTTNCSR